MTQIYDEGQRNHAPDAAGVGVCTLGPAAGWTNRTDFAWSGRGAFAVLLLPPVFNLFGGGESSAPDTSGGGGAALIVGGTGGAGGVGTTDSKPGTDGGRITNPVNDTGGGRRQRGRRRRHKILSADPGNTGDLKTISPPPR